MTGFRLNPLHSTTDAAADLMGRRPACRYTEDNPPRERNLLRAALTVPALRAYASHIGAADTGASTANRFTTAPTATTAITRTATTSTTMIKTTMVNGD